MPETFKLDHLHSIEHPLFRKFSNFFTFILGGQFLLPQMANNQRKGNKDLLTCGLGLVHDLTLVCFPPPQVTGTMAPAAFSLRVDSHMTSASVE